MLLEREQRQGSNLASLFRVCKRKVCYVTIMTSLIPAASSDGKDQQEGCNNGQHNRDHHSVQTSCVDSDELQLSLAQGTYKDPMKGRKLRFIEFA